MVLCACFAPLTSISAGPVPHSPATKLQPITVPAGTNLPISLTASIVSNKANTGDAFTFVADDDVVINGVIVVRKHALGNGTVVLAGAAGGHGHEGNLHLRFDTIVTAWGAPMNVGREVNFEGKNQKLLGRVSGLTWFTGFGQAVRGGQAGVDDKEIITLVLPADVCISPPGAVPCPVVPSAATAAPGLR